MTQHVYEITLPASIGMQSFAKANDDVRSAMGRLSDADAILSEFRRFYGENK